MSKIKKSRFDKFYTKPEIVDICLDNIDISSYHTIIEPAAGNGSFSLKIKGCISFDIQPDHDSIIKQDYLLWSPFNIDRPVLVIGNPPFGNNSSLAFKFINHSVFADTIAFILPRSFKKPSFQDRIPLNFHLRSSIDLPENSFLLNDKDYHVNCVFQIWDRKNYLREKSKKLKPISFKFVKKDENPDISIRRVGVNAGKIFFDIDKSPSSHYFIKADNVSDFVHKFNKIKFMNNTAGCNSISKQEIIKGIDFS